MRLPRPQFRLSTLLWITLAVACWFGGMRYERWRFEQEWRAEVLNGPIESLPLPGPIVIGPFEFAEPAALPPEEVTEI